LKKHNYLLILLWIVGGIFLGVEKVEAAPRPLTELDCGKAGMRMAF